jgi:hypothetical protein
MAFSCMSSLNSQHIQRRVRIRQVSMAFSCMSSLNSQQIQRRVRIRQVSMPFSCMSSLDSQQIQRRVRICQVSMAFSCMSSLSHYCIYNVCCFSHNMYVLFLSHLKLNKNNTQVNSCQSSSPPVVSVIRIAQSLAFCALFCRSLSVLFSVGHCIVCPLIFDYLFCICKLFFELRIDKN